jgi:galactoside O-acetyltransferase
VIRHVVYRTYRLVLVESMLWRNAIAAGLPGSLGLSARRRWARARGVALGPGAHIEPGLDLAGAENIRIGSDFTAMRNCSLRAERGSLTIGDRVALNVNVAIGASDGGTITIGDDVLIGPNVVVRASDHVYADATRQIRQQGHSGGKIIIDDDVWVAASVVITADVVVGKGAVVAAGAVVTKDVAPWTVVAGVPAQPVGVRRPLTGGGVKEARDVSELESARDRVPD